MNIRCPNKSTFEWKELVKAFGEKDAYKAYFRHTNPAEIPTVEQARGYLEAGSLKDRPPDAEQVKSVAEKFKDIKGDIGKTIAPYAVGQEGKVSSEVLRAQLGKQAMSNDRVDAVFKAASDLFAKSKMQDNLNFIYRMEAGEKQPTPELQTIANGLRTLLDNKRKEVQTLGTGKLEDFIENYFPHIWEDPSKAKQLLSYFTRGPLQGSKAFLKKRTIESTKEGIDKGLKPISYNPIDLTMLKVREMNRYLMAHHSLMGMKDEGLVKFVKVGGEKPEGFVKVNDAISDVYSINDKHELIKRGTYYMHPDAARIFNNYLSPGLRGNALYDLYRGGGNMLNQFQLGLSAFHLGFTSLDATISKFALGINQLSYGNFSGAAKAFAQTPTAALTNIFQGDKVFKAWHGKDMGATYNNIAEMMAQAGGRAHMDRFYATNVTARMKKAFQEGRYLRGALRVPFAIVEQASRPIMEYVVPRQKLGVFADLIKMELENKPNATHEEMRAIAQKAWDSVDNRMGQLVYDNLFWNKVTKDVAMASVRSLGWNLGTIREIGGGITVDTGKFINDAIHGRRPNVTYRMAYCMALPTVSGIIGAMYQYLATGLLPGEDDPSGSEGSILKDLYFPRTGGTDKSGNPARVSLPSYMKDLYHYTQAPVQTILNKFSPLNNALLEMWANKDFYGTEIRHQDDPAIKQVIEELKFAGTQFVPFGIRNLNRDTREGIGAKVEPFIGITPAPYGLNMTPAEKRAHEINMGKLPVGARTQEQAEKSKEKSDLLQQYKKTKDTAPLYQAAKDKKIKGADIWAIIKEAHMTPLQRATEHMTADEVKSVIEKASPTEKIELEKILKRKLVTQRK